MKREILKLFRGGVLNIFRWDFWGQKRGGMVGLEERDH